MASSCWNSASDHPEPTCPTGKRPFASRTAAAQARSHLRSGDRVRVYRCPACAQWHFTSRTGSGEADRRLAHRKRTRH